MSTSSGEGQTAPKEQTAPIVPDIPEGWLPGKITLVQMEALSSYFAERTAGSSRFTPRVCRGVDCPEAAECPLLRLGIDPPLGHQCFVELNLMKNFVLAAAAELDGEGSSVYDLNTIGSIAINNLLIKRLAERLAREEVIIDTVAAISEDGQQIMELKPHPSLLSIERLTRQIQMFQRDLLATRKEKSRDEARRLLSPTEVMDKLRIRMESVREGIEAGQRELLAHQGDVIDADFTLKEDTVEEDAPKDTPQETPQEAPQEVPQETPRDPQTGFLVNGDEDTKAS